MHEQVTVPTDSKAFELAEVGDALLDHPSDRAESDDLLAGPLLNDRLDALGAQPVAEANGVVAAVGHDGIGPAAGTTDPTGDRPNRFDQVLGGLDVGDVPCSGDVRERKARPVAHDVVFGAGLAEVHR
jgi:hypothetical protein